jgi:hypothetical protein
MIQIGDEAGLPTFKGWCGSSENFVVSLLPNFPSSS